MLKRMQNNSAFFQCILFVLFHICGEPKSRQLRILANYGIHHCMLLERLRSAAGLTDSVLDWVQHSWPTERTGCLQLLEILEIYWNLETLLEILEFNGHPRNFCVRWSTALVSKTGYQIAYLKKLVALFYLCYGPMLYKMHIMFLFYIWSNYMYRVNNVVDSVHYIAGRSNANMSRIFREIPPGVSWKSPGNLFS